MPEAYRTLNRYLSQNDTSLVWTIMINELRDSMNVEKAHSPQAQDNSVVPHNMALGTLIDGIRNYSPG